MLLLSDCPVIHGARAFSQGGTVVCETCCRRVNPVVMRWDGDVACPCCGVEGFIFDGTTLATPTSTLDRAVAFELV